MSEELKVGNVVSCKLQFDATIFWIATQIIGVDDGCILIGSRKYEFRMGDEGNSWIRGIHPSLRDPEMARLAGEVERLNGKVKSEYDQNLKLSSKIAELNGTQAKLDAANAELEKVREGFEKWYTGKYGEASIQKYGNGAYFYASTAAAWEVWQAATEAKQGDGWLSPNRMKGSTK